MLLQKWLLTVSPATTPPVPPGPSLSPGPLFAYGLNASGQLGNNTTVAQTSSPIQIGTSSWTTVATGYSTTVGLRSDGTLWTWGNNTFGQLGNNDATLIHRSSPIQVGTSSWTAIAAKGDTYYGIQANGLLYAWGVGFYGGIGNNSFLTVNSPSYSYTSIGGSFTHKLMRTTIGGLYAMGDNGYGQFGNGITSGGIYSPVQVAAAKSWTSVSAGTSYSEFIDSDGRLYAAGWNNAYGNLGDGTIIDKSSPVQIGSNPNMKGTSWVQVIAGIDNITVALASNPPRSLWVWGNNTNGALGTNARVHRSSPFMISTITTPGQQSAYATQTGLTIPTWLGLSVGQGSVVGVKSDYTLWTWGKNDAGALGQDDEGNLLNRSSPVQLGTSSWLVASAGINFMVAIKLDGTLWSWGTNAQGQLGLNDVNIHRSSPVQIASGSWTTVDAGISFAGAIRSDGTLWTWGAGTVGQLGVNTLVNRSSPVQVAGSWNQVRFGLNHTMGLATNNTLWTWGNNTNGQLGFNDRVHRSSPTQVGTSSWTSISTGNQYSLAIRNGDMSLWMWGDNVSGNLGLTNRVNRSSPVQIGTSSWTMAMTARYSNFFYVHGITTIGSLIGWGLNINGQLGDNTQVSRSSPVQIGTSSWSFLAQRADCTVAGILDNTIFTWGSGGSGSSGLNVGTSFTSSPVFLRSLTDSWDDVEVTSHVVALRKGGNLYAWGFNAQGQLGLGDQINRSSPSQVGTSSWSQIATGVLNSYGLLNNKLYSWGDNQYGQIGDNTTATYLSPVQIGTSSWTTINAGYYIAYATNTSNKLFAWGYGGDGSIGNNTAINYSSPVQIGTNNWDAKNINSWQGTLGIDNSGILYTWGYNVNGLIGRFFSPDSPGGSVYVNTSSPVQLGSVSYFISPTQVGSGSWSQVSTGFSHVIGTRSDGSLYGWGINNNGQVGDGTFITKSSPVLIDSGNWTSISASSQNYSLGVKNNELYGWGIPPSQPKYSWTQIAAARAGFRAIRSDGLLFAWGRGNTGQLGFNETIPRSAPIQIGTSSWSQVAALGGTTFGITADNRLFSWGDDSNGVLGLNTVGINYSSPVQVGTSSWSFIKLSAGDRSVHVLAIKINGTLWAWGSNSSGQLGDGTLISKSSPVQVGTANDWVYSFAGNFSSFAIKSSGLLYAWGSNGDGSLGDGTTINRSSPVQIGTSSWTAVASGDHSNAPTIGRPVTVAIKSNNTLYAWGNNDIGQLGLNDKIHRSSPVQVGTSSWSMVDTKHSNTKAITVDGKLFTFGLGSLNGELMNSISYSSPVQIGTSSWSFVGLTGSPDTESESLIVKDTIGQIWLWGDTGQVAGGGGIGGVGALGLNLEEGNGQVPNIPVFIQRSPIKYSNSISWSQISAGSSHILGLSSSNSLYGWGAAGAAPYTISTDSITMIGATNGFNCFALTNNGTMYAWTGNSQNYQESLGVINAGTQSNFTASPYFFRTQTPNISGNPAWSWKSVVSGGNWSLAIRSNDTLYAVGVNTVGQLGNGTTLDSLTYWDQSGNRTWNVIAADTGGTVSGITKTDNYLWAWGDNTYGQIANGSFDLTAKSSPVQVSSLLNNIAEASWQTSNPSMPYWTSLNMEGGQGSALRSDGAIFTWGSNTLGTLGDGTVIHRSSPVQIGTSSWSMINTQGNVTSAIRQDGMLFTWGQNGNGNLALSDRAHRSSPVQVGTSSWLMVRASNFGSTGILSTGALFTWGSSTSGILGNSLLVNRSSPVQIGTSSWTFVNVSEVSPVVAAITSDKRLFAWGLNTSGQLGDGTILSRSSPVQIGTSSWNQVSLGGSSGGAVRLDGALFTWGSDSAGALGSNTRNVNRSSPVQIGTSSWSQVSVGTDFMTAIKTDGTLYSWGSNSRGNLGSDNSAGRSSPVQVGTSSWSMVNNGANSNSGLTNKSAFLWGLGGGQGAFPMLSVPSGNALSNYRSSPVFLKSASIPDTFTKAGSFGGMIAAIRSDGLLFAWGRGDSGQLGNNTVNNANGDVVQIGNSSWTSLNTSSSGSNTMFAIRSDGALFVWGGNDYGMSGNVSGVAMSSPVQITSIWSEAALNSYTANTGITFPTSWTKVSLGSGASAAIDSNGKLYMWGDNTYGQLGDGTIISQGQPEQIGNSSWTQVSTNISNSDIDLPGNFYNTMAIRSDGTLWAWGSNSFGQLGDNTIIDRSSPVQVGTSSWSQISTANTAFAAIKSDNTLWMWGRNVYGNLGDNTTINRSSPVQIGTSSWSAISLGLTMSLGILSTGKLFSWGANSSPYTASQSLGLNDTVHRSSPTQIGTFNYTTASTTAGDNYRGFSAAITTTGALFTWGDNTYGELGVPDIFANNKSSPIQVGTSSWTTLNIAGFTTFAKTVDGLQFGWGVNSSGQLGNGTNTSYGSPVQITSRAWNSLTAGPSATFWFGSSSVLYGSGNNSILPMNSTNQTSPIFINTGQYDSWIMASTGNNYSLMLRKDNVLFSAGRNNIGQLGIGNTTLSSTAIPQSPLIGTVKYAVASSDLPMALGADNILYSWTTSAFVLQTIARSAPTQIANSVLYGVPSTSEPIQIGTSSWAFIAAGDGQSYATNNTSALYQWNFNNNVQVYYPMTSSPTLVGMSAYSMTVGLNNNNIIKKN
jgi:alpha-tubulin suppressor-like RCC1 family protein